MSEIPRRARVDRWIPAERAIQAAIDVVEAAGADIRLSDAVVDFVDGVKTRRQFTELDEQRNEAGEPEPSEFGDPSLLDIATALVRDEVERATAKFPTWPTDPLHALGVVAEEFGELSKAVVQETYEPHKNAPGELRKEAIQCAAMAIRFVMSLDAYELRSCEQHRQSEEGDRD